jgi:iron complex outermembrane receptor protein
MTPSPRAIPTSATSTSIDRTYSGFAQVTWHILPNLIFDAGARYIAETKHASVENTFVNNTIIAPVAAAVFLPEGDKLSAIIPATALTPEATLTYKPTHNSSVYLAYKTGFQSGGMSDPGLPPPISSASALVFQPERAHGEEFGYKFESEQRDLRFDLTLYNYEFSDLQVQSAKTTEAYSGVETVLYTISNAANAYTRGVELEGEWNTPLKGFAVNGFWNYNIAKYGSYVDAPCNQFETTAAYGCMPIAVPGGINGGLQTTGVNLTGATLPNAPVFTMRLGFTYDHPLTSQISFGVAFDANYQSSVFLAQPAIQEANYPSVCLNADRLCGMWLYSGALRFYTNDHKWELAVTGTNLANKLYPTSWGFALAGDATQQSASIGNPREVIMQLKYKF